MRFSSLDNISLHSFSSALSIKPLHVSSHGSNFCLLVSVFDMMSFKKIERCTYEAWCRTKKRSSPPLHVARHIFVDPKKWERTKASVLLLGTAGLNEIQ
jgi:hypothetical protein